MSFLDQIWDNIPQLIENNLNNGQDKRDACRLFYVAAVTNNVEIKSFKTRICDIYRPFKDNYYEQYLISSHLLSLKFDISSLKSIPYFIRWLKELLKDEFDFYLAMPFLNSKIKNYDNKNICKYLKEESH